MSFFWFVFVIITVNSLATLCWADVTPPHVSIAPHYTTQQSPIGRYALVLSVEHYRNFRHVVNARNDGATISNALLKTGFSFVRHVPDPETSDIILDHIEELMRQARSESQPAVLVVYFAGHGFQFGNSNYIVPAKASEKSIIRDSLPISTIVRRIATSEISLAILFLDACRTVHTLDNTNAQTPLLSNHEPGYQRMPENGVSVIGTAASHGFAAQSIGRGEPRASPYAWALGNYIPLESLSLDSMFDDVSNYVMGDTGERQRPMEVKRAGSSRFFFKPGESEEAQQARVWKRVLNSGVRRACLESFIRTFPASSFGAQVKYLLSLSGEKKLNEPACDVLRM